MCEILSLSYVSILNKLPLDSWQICGLCMAPNLHAPALLILVPSSATPSLLSPHSSTPDSAPRVHQAHPWLSFSSVLVLVSGQCFLWKFTTIWVFLAQSSAPIPHHHKGMVNTSSLQGSLSNCVSFSRGLHHCLKWLAHWFIWGSLLARPTKKESSGKGDWSAQSPSNLSPVPRIIWLYYIFIGFEAYLPSCSLKRLKITFYDFINMTNTFISHIKTFLFNFLFRFY